MIAEGSSFSQTPGPRGGPPRPDEPDHLAERRARRAAAESGESAALLRRAEAAEATVRTLETHIASLQQRLRESEGDNRQRTHELAQRLERVEGALQTVRDSHRRMAQTIGELKEVTVRLRAAAETGPEAESAPTERSREEPVDHRREEMAEALAAAVERLRARAQETSPLPIADAPSAQVAPAQGAPAQVAPAQVAPAQGAPAQGASVEVVPAQPPVARHKHSRSLIGRLLAARAARKYRRKER